MPSLTRHTHILALIAVTLPLQALVAFGQEEAVEPEATISIAVLPFAADEGSTDGYLAQALLLSALGNAPGVTLVSGERFASVAPAIAGLRAEGDAESLVRAARVLGAQVLITGRCRGDDGGTVAACVTKPSSPEAVRWTDPISMSAALEGGLVAQLTAFMPGIGAAPSPDIRSALDALALALRDVDQADRAAAASEAEAAQSGYAAAVDKLGTVVADLRALPSVAGAVEHVCRAALAGRGDFAGPVYCLGVIHYARGDYAQALGACERAMTMSENEPLVLNLKGLTHQARGELEQAREALTRAVEADDEAVVALHNLGRVLVLLGDTEAARARFMRVLELNADPGASALSHIALADLLLAADDAPNAVEHLDAAVNLAPELPEAHYNRGIALHRSGRFEEAVEAYTAALALRPNDPAARNNLGIALFELGRMDEAIVEYTQALELDPGLTVAHRNLAVAHEKQGSFGAAVTDWEAYLQGATDLSAEGKAEARRRLRQAEAMSRD